MYKKILCLGALVSVLSPAVLAADLSSSGGDYSPDTGVANSTLYNPGIYFGVQVGTTNMHYSGSEYTSSKSSYDDKYQVAARGHLGYAFSQFISTELGYDYYGQPKFWSVNGNTQNIVQQGLDLMVKANLPLDYGFGVYVKGGMAWVYRSALRGNGGDFANKESNNKFPIIGAIGLNYWFAPNIALDLCYTKTMRVSSLPTIDIFTAGVIYKINL